MRILFANEIQTFQIKFITMFAISNFMNLNITKIHIKNIAIIYLFAFECLQNEYQKQYLHQ